MEITKDTLLYIALFIIPGYTMNAAYSSFVPQRILDQQITTLRYLCFSFLNYAIWFWLILDLIEQRYWEDHPFLWILCLLFILLVSPYIIGFLAGVVTSKAWIRRILQKIGLNPVHSVPTAWDYVMSNGSWVIVTLKNGSLIYGLYSSNSFASTVPEERDIYIESVYDKANNGNWLLNTRSKGIWIAKDEIQLIEFWAFEEGEDDNGKTPSK